MLERALERWEGLSGEERLLPQAPGAAPMRREDLFPEDGLALRVHARDLPREKQVPGWRANAWNRDTAWLTKAEARALLPQEIAVDATTPWPEAVVDRIVRLHLVDNVRGQVSAFPEGSVERAQVEGRIVEAGEEGVRVEFTGATRAETRGRWPIHGFSDGSEPTEQVRGLEARLLGRAVYDPGAERFVAFEMVAIGERWGGTQFNGRGDDLEPSPIGVFFALAESGPAERVAPAAIGHYGWP